MPEKKCRAISAAVGPQSNMHALWLEMAGDNEQAVYAQKELNEWNGPKVISPQESDAFLPDIVIDEDDKALA